MNKITLLTVTGENTSGAKSALLETLTAPAISLIDINLAVVNNQLTLALSLSLGAEASLSAFENKVSELGLTLTSAEQDVSTDLEWVKAQDADGYVVTVMGPRVSSDDLAHVFGLLDTQGVVVDKTTRLSAFNATERTGFELLVSGELTSADVLRSEFLTASAARGIDINLQENRLSRLTSRVAVFDMDSTLIQAEVIDELAKAAGIGEQVIAITESAMRGEIDFNESFRRRVGLLKGLDASVLEEIAKNLPITDGLAELMANLKAQGYKTAILSGGFTYFAEHLKARFGFDYIHANVLDIVDGKVTGEVTGEIVNGEKKAEFLRAIAEKEGVALAQTVAVGDGANDLPMLSIAGLGVAFRAKPVVRERAEQAVTALGLDGVLYLLGFQDKDLV